MFKTGVLQQHIKLNAREVGSNVRSVLEDRVRALLEGTCGPDGYIRPGTVEILEIGSGYLSRIDMGRRYEFKIKIKAEICNPEQGLHVLAVVRSINKFGILAEGGFFNHEGVMVPVIEIIIVKDIITSEHEIDFDTINVGDEIAVEILGKRYELRDKRISALGKLVKNDKKIKMIDETVLEDKTGLQSEDDADSQTDISIILEDNDPGKEDEENIEDADGNESLFEKEDGVVKDIADEESEDGGEAIENPDDLAEDDDADEDL